MTKTAPERKVLTIERATWYRGKGSEESMLLNHAGLKCCLGFDALARGLSPAQILCAGDPDGVANQPAEYDEAMSRLDPDGFTSQLRPEVVAAIKHNDDIHLSEDERERLIREDLIALGWDDVVFV